MIPSVLPRRATSFAYAFAGGLALVLLGCGHPPPSSPNELAPLDDGQIAEIVDVIDTEQIQTAQLGIDHAAAPETRAFAEDLLRDQKAARKELLARLAAKKINLQPSILLELFESRERAARAWLSNEIGPTFDRSFLANEVKEQTIQLDWLDRMLIPNAHDAELRVELGRRRTIAAARLASAQRLGQNAPQPSPPPLL